LKDVPAGDRPPLVTVFFAFRIMIAIGFFMPAARCSVRSCGGAENCSKRAGICGRWRRPGGWIRRGHRRLGGDRERRQPWIVQGILRTADATSPVIGPAIAVTFALFIVVYGIIFSAGIYFINRLIAKGLDTASADEPAVSLGGALAAAGRSTER